MACALIDLAEFLGAALGRLVAPTERLAVAVSGGPDSIALLLLAQAAFPGRVQALTVDHGLRAAAAAEAAFVASLCTARGIPHQTLPWTGPKPAANRQAEARNARYALLRDACAAAGIGVLATAHHADDQAETLLMRLARGSGGGLAGIRMHRPLGAGVTLVRPLLGVRRAALAAIVAEVGIVPVTDPTNDDPHYDRTHARRLLASTPWLDAARLADSAAHLAEAEAALDWAADRAWAGRAEAGDGAVHARCRRAAGGAGAPAGGARHRPSGPGGAPARRRNHPAGRPTRRRRHRDPGGGKGTRRRTVALHFGTAAP